MDPASALTTTAGAVMAGVIDLPALSGWGLGMPALSGWGLGMPALSGGGLDMPALLGGGLDMPALLGGGLDMPALLGGPNGSLSALVVLTLLIGAWIFLCNWMAGDVPWVGADKNLWFGIPMGVGTLGLVAILLLPVPAAIIVWMLGIGGQAGSWIIYRNTQVPKHMRVLTVEWFKAWMTGMRKTQISLDNVAKAPVDIIWKDGPSNTFDPPEEPDYRQGFDEASHIVYDAAMRRASDIQLVPVQNGEATEVRFGIDGFQFQGKKLERGPANNTLLWLKKVAGADINEYRKPQKGKFAVLVGPKGKQRKLDLMINTRGSVQGQTAQLRLLDRAALRRLADLGLSPELYEKFKQIAGLQKGLLVVGGPPTAGITSTLYALVREHDLFQQNVATVEDPVDMDIENVTQEEYKGEGGKVSYAKHVQSFFRGKDPDCLMIGRSDPEVLPIAALAAERKKIYAALEFTSAVEGLGKVIKAVGDAELLNRSLIGVSCQKLVRVLCPECKVAYKPPADALKRINVAPERVHELYRPPTEEENKAGGRTVCTKCQGTGYFGQTGAFELLVISDPIRKLIASGSPLKDIQTEARKERMLYLHEHILSKVISGETSVPELMRVTQSGPATK